MGRRSNHISLVGIRRHNSANATLPGLLNLGLHAEFH